MCKRRFVIALLVCFTVPATGMTSKDAHVPTTHTGIQCPTKNMPDTTDAISDFMIVAFLNSTSPEEAQSSVKFLLSCHNYILLEQGRSAAKKFSEGVISSLQSANEALPGSLGGKYNDMNEDFMRERLRDLDVFIKLLREFD